MGLCCCCMTKNPMWISCSTLFDLFVACCVLRQCDASIPYERKFIARKCEISIKMNNMVVKTKWAAKSSSYFSFLYSGNQFRVVMSVIFFPDFIFILCACECVCCVAGVLRVVHCDDVNKLVEIYTLHFYEYFKFTRDLKQISSVSSVPSSKSNTCIVWFHTRSNLFASFFK